MVDLERSHGFLLVGVWFESKYLIEPFPYDVFQKPLKWAWLLCGKKHGVNSLDDRPPTLSIEKTACFCFIAGSPFSSRKPYLQTQEGRMLMRETRCFRVCDLRDRSIDRLQLLRVSVSRLYAPSCGRVVLSIWSCVRREFSLRIFLLFRA